MLNGHIESLNTTTMVQTGGRLDRATTHKLSIMLDKVCKTIDGHSVYEDDWNDQRVADTLGIARHHVKYARTQVFGPTAKPIGGSTVHKNLSTRVEELERRLYRIERLLIQTTAKSAS